MIKEIYRINSEGIYKDVYLANLEENTYYNGEKWFEIDFNYVEIKPPNAKILKWEIDHWTIIEGYPVEPTPPEPTTEDYLLDLDYRLSKLELGL